MNNQNGFTLIEVLIASVIIASGLVTMGVFLGNYVNKNGQNEHRTMASVIAEQKIEELRTRALGNVEIFDVTTKPPTVIYTNGDLTSADSSSTGVAPNMVTALDANGDVLGATGAAGEVYTLSWRVDDTNNPHTVSVTVTWDGIGNSQVTLATLVNDDA